MDGLRVQRPRFDFNARYSRPSLPTVTPDRYSRPLLSGATASIFEFLEAAPASDRIEVAYEQNRAVLFNSNLFHASQPPRFAPGYTNRRINLTFLFGDRATCAA